MNEERLVETYYKMKSIMKKRFVPEHYCRELIQKLQGFKNIKHYHMEMEIAIIRADIIDDREVIMTRFLNNLNKEINNG